MEFAFLVPQDVQLVTPLISTHAHPVKTNFFWMEVLVLPVIQVVPHALLLKPNVYLVKLEISWTHRLIPANLAY